ncbi:hypothetical protein ACFVU2_19050 [Leifsonia sp. NPDC058194]|uniref:hypothetical protein n=1 Tax=Leifsonia sp. NPDC058194 TaxID=3346374 RepID=UPI0036D8114A
MTDPNIDLVHLSHGPLFRGEGEYNDGELVPRSQVPDHAVRGGGNVQSDGTDGGVEGQWYEEWVVED